MDIILDVEGMQGLNFLRTKKTNSAYLIILFSFSFFLVSCGGGNGPGDEGENPAASQNSSNITYNNGAGQSKIAVQTKNPSTIVAANACQSTDILFCETFEWSSSLAYHASKQDWQLKGWQFRGSQPSGTDCNSVGADGSQCALKWVQNKNVALNTLQKASYVFSEYGSAYNKIVLSWKAKWSANWSWDAVLNPHVSLETTNLSSTQTPLISLGFDQMGIAKIIIAEDKLCGREKRIIKSDKVITLGNTLLAGWHYFKLTVNSRYDTGNKDTVQLSINNNVVLSVSDVNLSCGFGGVTTNTITYMSNSNNPTVNAEQYMLIDNILLTM